MSEKIIQEWFFRREIFLERSGELTTGFMISASVIHRFLRSEQIDAFLHESIKDCLFVLKFRNHIPIENNQVFILVVRIIQQFRNDVFTSVNIIDHDKRGFFFIWIARCKRQSILFVYIRCCHTSVYDINPFMRQHFLRINTITIGCSGSQRFYLHGMQQGGIFNPISRIEILRPFFSIIMSSVIRSQLYPADRRFIRYPDNSCLILFYILQIRPVKDLYLRSCHLSGNCEQKDIYQFFNILHCK